MNSIMNGIMNVSYLSSAVKSDSMFMALLALASVWLTNVIKICSHLLLKKNPTNCVHFGFIIKDQNCILSAPTKFVVLNFIVFSRVLTKLGKPGLSNTLSHLTASRTYVSTRSSHDIPPCTSANITMSLLAQVPTSQCPSLHK